MNATVIYLPERGGEIITGLGLLDRGVWSLVNVSRNYAILSCFAKISAGNVRNTYLYVHTPPLTVPVPPKAK